ncbi:hypothetical protein ACFQ1Q_07815 [Winogradskyella litorisediminis]|uniref:Uncharacterized protein n=1 Tax=Winogradskyella litorisediminis TaxID=1156618 RepID=A0ABW3N967_9FLAO
MSIQAMNTAINNNRKLLPKRDKLKNRLGGYDPTKKTEYNLPKASSKQLRDLRKRLQLETKIWWIKAISLTSVLFGIMVYFFLKYA